MPTCIRCNKDDLKEDDFPLNGDGKGGRRKQCKNCMRDINKQWRIKNREKVAVYNRGRRGPKQEIAAAPDPQPT